MKYVLTLASSLRPFLWWVGCAFAALGVLYTVIALFAALRPRRPTSRRTDGLRPVTLLKPLFGLEAELYPCLRSFCSQRYPALQIVFGVASHADPAIAVVQQLRKEFPGQHIDLVVDSTRHGSNPKVNNLVNMMAQAKHDWVILADSDIIVSPDYIEQVVNPLHDERVGIVTCAYSARSQGGLWSRLSAEFICGWFTPSVFVSDLFGSRAFAFGATIALRRQVLNDIGGFHAIANHLADDYRLGELVRGLRLETVLSEVVVETVVSETSFRAMVWHQLRWLRTIRGVRPVGHALAGVTFSLPLAMLAWLLADGDQRIAASVAVIMAMRAVISGTLSKGPRGRLIKICLIPVTDLIAFSLWFASFASHRVLWRNAFFDIDWDGLAHPANGSRQDPGSVPQPSRSLSSGEIL